MEDEKIPQKVQHYFQSPMKNDNKTIAYNSQGKALTTKEYKASVEEYMAQFKKGKWVNQKEMDKVIK